MLDPPRGGSMYASEGDLAALSAEARAANRKIVVGTLWEQDKPEFTKRWDEFVKDLR